MERRDAARDFRNLVAEASYVGNRGMWWPTPAG